jgi:hypothetical protein
MWRDIEPGERSCITIQPILPLAETISISDMYTKICSIEMDLSHLPLVAQPRLNGEPGMFYEIEYETVLMFGLTELKAQIAWKENVS